MRRKLLAALRTAIGVPLFFLFTLVLASYLIVMALILPHHPYLDRVIRFWSRRFLGVAPVKLHVDGGDRVDAEVTTGSGAQYAFAGHAVSR